VDLYIHSPIRRHGIVLNYLSTGTTLPLPYAMLLCTRSCWEGDINQDHVVRYKQHSDFHTVTCIGVRMTKITGSSSDDWIY
jgi:hypothetical protein